MSPNSLIGSLDTCIMRFSQSLESWGNCTETGRYYHQVRGFPCLCRFCLIYHSLNSLPLYSSQFNYLTSSLLAREQRPCLKLIYCCLSNLLHSIRHLVRRRRWHPTPVLLPGKSHGQRSLVGCSPWGREKSDTTERLHFHFSLSCIGEGNGNPLQCSCLENPRDGEAWWATVAQSWTRLK